MSGNRFNYSPSSIGGKHLAAAVSNAVIALEEATRAYNIAQSVAAGSAANLEGATEFGVPASPPGQGAAFLSAIATLQADLQQLVTAGLLGNLDQSV